MNATHSLGVAPDPWAELQIEALWAHRQRLDLPGVIKFLLASLASLERQGLRPNAVLIEDAANGPAVCQLLKRQVPGLIAIPPKGSKAEVGAFYWTVLAPDIVNPGREEQGSVSV